MSIQAVGWVLEHSKSKGSARLVLISLANHANDGHGGECWPASRTVAKEAGVSSHTTVLSAIEVLVALGEVEVVETGSQRRSARYRLTFMPQTERSRIDHKSTTEASPDEPQRSTQTDQNRNEPEETVRVPARTSNGTKTKTRLTDDWEPSERTKAWCREEFPQYATRGTLGHFKDHHIGEGNRKLDWDRAFQTWVRRQPRFERSSSGPTRTFL